MEALSNLMLGLGVVLSPSVLVHAVLGCVLGTIVGVLPGLGPLAGMSLLLPLSFTLEPTTAMVLLAGIYYGSMYGGSTTSILMRLPGEAASVVTCIDGYEMTKAGRAGPALSIAAIASFVAGTTSTVALMLLAPPMAAFALTFGPPEYTALFVAGLVVLTYMSSGSMLRTIALATFGLLLGTVGIDTMSGFTRFTMNMPELGDGLGLVPISVGLFGLSELLIAASQARTPPLRGRVRLAELLPSRQDLRLSAAPIGRGSVLGFLVGIIPGSAHIISSFLSYAVERRLSRHPERFGKGAIEGVAGPEAANNSAASGAFVSMLALGVPFGAVQALMLATLMVHGIAPGPQLVDQQPALFWGFIASMYVGNIVLLALNIPLVGFFVSLMRIPYAYIYPVIIVFCILGVYSVNSSVIDLWILIGAGAVGYLLRRNGYDLAPVMLGFIIAPMLEMAFRQSLAMSAGSYGIFIERPIALGLFVLAGLMLLGSLVPTTARWRRTVELES